MKSSALAALGLTLLVGAGCASTGGQDQRHNVILFVPDGLRAAVVEPGLAPTFAAIRDEGVNFANSHSVLPTFTTPNAAALATGHYPGDSGQFGNTLYPGFSSAHAGATLTPFLEINDVIQEVDEHHGGNYLNETSVLAAARAAGYSTAAIGKLGPVALQDATARGKLDTIIIDDDTGNGGWPIAADVVVAIKAAGLSVTPPPRSNATANTVQQSYFVDVATKVLLPRFKAAKKPFFLVYWSRDPDATQHAQKDSPGAFVPGINGPSALAAIRDTDRALASLRAALKEQGLAATTNIVVSADHGFSTISKESKTSPSAGIAREGYAKGELPSGFLAVDLALALDLPLRDPDAFKGKVAIKSGALPRKGNGLIGRNEDAPDIIVAANGGSDLIYLPTARAPALAKKIVTALLAQDYVSGIFVSSDLGEIAGTLPLSAINFEGAALTPRPAIVVSFRSFDTGCGAPLRCTVSVADGYLRQGQGMHGSFSRADTANFQAAIGPDFKTRFRNNAPSSNADISITIAHLLKLDIPPKGKLSGRVLSESLKGGPATVEVKAERLKGPDANGLATELRYQTVGETRYFDAAGFAGRTVGLDAP